MELKRELPFPSVILSLVCVLLGILSLARRAFSFGVSGFCCQDIEAPYWGQVFYSSMRLAAMTFCKSDPFLKFRKPPPIY